MHVERRGSLGRPKSIIPIPQLLHHARPGRSRLRMRCGLLGLVLGQLSGLLLLGDRALLVLDPETLLHLRGGRGAARGGRGALVGVLRWVGHWS